MSDAGGPAFSHQFQLMPKDYVSGLDFYTWTRHFHLFKDVIARVQGDLLEVGTGDGILKRCAQPFLRSYTVMDINAHLQPDVLADVSVRQATLCGRFDAVVAAEILEHLPFADFERCIGHLQSYLKPGGLFFLTVPHRKSHMMVVTPRQRLSMWRFPVGLTSLSEAYHRFVRRRIWIDPHHCWEIGDGSVKRKHVEGVLVRQGLAFVQFMELPYCDYWVLRKGAGGEP